MESLSLKHWHVLYVKDRHEKKVALLLKEKDIEVFLPLIKSIRIWSDRKKKIYLPLFSRYLFVQVSSKKDFYDVLSTEGVIKYIKFGNNCARVRDEEILQIKQLINLNGISDIKAESTVPVKGQKMKICYGPLNGVSCEVINVNNKSKVVIRIESIHHYITAYLPAFYLTPMVFSENEKQYSNQL